MTLLSSQCVAVCVRGVVAVWCRKLQAGAGFETGFKQASRQA